MNVTSLSSDLSFACSLLSDDPQDLSEDEAKGLSPGLCYLEHVCQRLEEFAEQQRHNQALQRQKNALKMHLEAEAGQAEPVLEVSHQVGFINLARVGVLVWCCGLKRTRTLVCLRFRLLTPARLTLELPERRDKGEKTKVRRGVPVKGGIPGPSTHTSGRDQRQTQTLQPYT